MANYKGDRWWTSQTLAVVTGANKGIGLEIVRQLAENDLTVVLTARDVNRGLTAVKTLHNQGVNNVLFRQLDIHSAVSVSDFASWLKDNHGGLDILVNNAAILGATVDKKAVIYAATASEMKDDVFNCPLFAKAFETDNEMSKKCIETNYYGTKRLTEALLPLMRSSSAGARIVNVSSEAGLLQYLKIYSLRHQLSDASNITEELIDKMIERFLEDMNNGELERKGWQLLTPQYCVSKIALNAYSRLLARRFSNREEGRRIYVNNVHPGVVQTDMNDYLGDLTASQGAENCVRVALMAPGGSSGQFYYMKERHSF